MSRPSLLAQVLSKKMVVCFLMGYASGLPLLLTLSTLQAWMKDEGVDLGSIGMIALVGVPYSWKFLWAPVFDRFVPPFLGRRRGWMVAAQVCVALSIASMSVFNPASALTGIAAAACLTAFFSASQDIVVDSYRREYLRDEELGLGSSLYIYGYRIAMLLSGAGALFLADRMPWDRVYLLMALGMAPAILTTLWAPEPQVDEAPPKSFKEAVVAPFVEFFGRDSLPHHPRVHPALQAGGHHGREHDHALLSGDGFSKSQIAAVTKLFGFWAVLAGTFLGGLLLLRSGIAKCLYIFGVLQGVSTAGFALLASHPSLSLLTGVIAFENISGGMGTAAYTAYMATQTNKRFTATQFALLTSVMGLPPDRPRRPHRPHGRVHGLGVVFHVSAPSSPSRGCCFCPSSCLGGGGVSE